MEKAIKLAIAGGWQWKRNSNEIIEYKIYAKELGEVGFNDMLMDPEFWKGLGKSLGWGWRQYCPCGDWIPASELLDSSNRYCGWCSEHEEKMSPVTEELHHWISLITHINAGGTVDAFFNELLANK